MTEPKLSWRAASITLLALIGGCDVFTDDATRIERATAHIEAREYRSASIELKNVLRSDPANIEARLLLGKALLEAGDTDGATKELRRASELGATAGQYLHSYARALLRNGSYNEVVDLDIGQLDDPAARAAVLVVMGRAELALGDSAGATERFEQALALVPDHVEAELGLAHVARANGDLDEAAAGFDRVLASDPVNFDALASYGQLQFIRGDYAASEELFQRAYEATYENRVRDRMVYLSGVIQAQLAQGDLEAARSNSTQLLSFSNEHPLAMMQAARVDYAGRNLAQAVTRAEQVVAQLPEYEPARMLLAAAALAQGNRVLAANQLQTVINTNPGNEQARKMLARVHMDLGSAEEAVAVLEPLLAAGATDAEALMMAGSARIQSGQQESGITLLERGAEISVDNPQLAMQSANALLAAGETDRAIEILEAIPNDEGVGNRDLLLVLAKLRSGDIAAARAQAQSVLDRRPDDPAAHRLMGGFFLSTGDLDAAREEFGKVLELNANDKGAILSLARVDVAAGNPAAAQRRLEAVLEREPGDLATLNALAQVAAMQGDTAQAVVQLERARKANPAAAEPSLKLARHFLEQGDLARAEQLALEAVRKAPNSGHAHLMLGMVRTRDGRPSEAQASLERATIVQPNFAEAHLMLGGVRQELGLLDAAIASYKRAIELSPDSLMAHSALAGAYVALGNAAAADKLAGELVERFPDRAEPLVLVGDLANGRDQLAEALEAYNKAARIAPDRSLAAKRADVRRRLGYDNPANVLEDWVREHPDDMVARQMLGEHYLAAGQYERAITAYTATMEAAPSAATAMKMAAAHNLAGRAQQAVRWLERALELEPGSAQAKAALANLELRRGNQARALQLAQALRKSNPDVVDHHVLEAAALGASGDHAASAAAYERAQALAPSAELLVRIYDARRRAGDRNAWRLLERWAADHPDDMEVTMRLAEHYEQNDLNDEAVEAYRRVLYDDPNNFIVLNNIAWVYLKRGDEGDIKRGVNAASRAYERRKDIPAVADTYGWLLLHDGQTDKALQLLRQAALDAPDMPEIGYHYAVALHRSGNAVGAREQLDRVLASQDEFSGRDEAERLRRTL